MGSAQLPIRGQAGRAIGDVLAYSLEEDRVLVGAVSPWC